MFTVETIEKMTTDPRWLGFGYLGERRNLRAEVVSGERFRTDVIDLIARADALALAQANMYGLDADTFFHWANSIQGRKYGDCWFGSGGRHASSYLPTEFGKYL